MKKLFKKVIAVTLLVCMLISSASCNVMLSFDLANEIEDTSTALFEGFVKEDTDVIMRYLSDALKSDLKNDRYVKDALKGMFKFIDGDIVSYEFKGSGRGDQSTNADNKLVYYLCNPEFTFETSTGRQYHFESLYYYACDIHPEAKGFGYICIMETDQSPNNFVTIGTSKIVSKK